MRVLIHAFVSFTFFATAAWADADPQAGSKAALNGLVDNYRNTVVQLFEFEAKATEATLQDSGYLNYRDQVLTTVFLGLDNLNTTAANQLIVDLSAVYVGESVGPLYSCVLRRKAKVLSLHLQKTLRLNDWCSKNLPDKFCLKNDEAKLRLRSGIEKSKNAECEVPLY